MAIEPTAEVTVSVSTDRASLRRAEKEITKSLARVEQMASRGGLLSKSYTQPLGKITGAVGEFEKSLEASNARVIAFGASAAVIYNVGRALDFTVRAVIDLEHKLAEVNVILNASASGLQKFGAELFDIAKMTGQSFEGVSQAALEFARQGLNVQETLTRTRDAMILVRLAGLDVQSSVEAVTATINSFNQTVITSTQLVNKLANVDAAFAVSSADLAKAVSRVGSSAQSANVSLDELIAMVTTAQQVTARGGAVIGNSFKTIFTRIQRPAVISNLEAFGVAVTNASGDALPAIQILKNFAAAYDGMTGPQRAATAEMVGGVFQVNVLKAAIGDLGKKFSIYDRALKTSVGSTDEAIQRNAALNKTLQTLIGVTMANLLEVGAKIGKITLSPAIRNVLESVNSALDGIKDSAEGGSIGVKMGEGILTGIGTILKGPGMVILGALLGKLLYSFSKFSGDAIRTFAGMNEGARRQAEMQMLIQNILLKNPDLIDHAASSEENYRRISEKVLEVIKNRNYALAQAEKLSKSIAQNLSRADLKAINTATGGGSTAGSWRPVAASRGLIPNFVDGQAAVAEKAGALAGGYKPGKVKERQVKGIGKVVYNAAETVKKFPNMKQEAIMPPQRSDAGKAYEKKFKDRHGFDPYAFRGLIPNFARGTSLIGESKLPQSEILKQLYNQIDVQQVAKNAFGIQEPSESHVKAIHNVFSGNTGWRNQPTKPAFQPFAEFLKKRGVRAYEGKKGVNFPRVDLSKQYEQLDVPEGAIDAFQPDSISHKAKGYGVIGAYLSTGRGTEVGIRLNDLFKKYRIGEAFDPNDRIQFSIDAAKLPTNNPKTRDLQQSPDFTDPQFKKIYKTHLAQVKKSGRPEAEGGQTKVVKEGIAMENAIYEWVNKVPSVFPEDQRRWDFTSSNTKTMAGLSKMVGFADTKKGIEAKRTMDSTTVMMSLARKYFEGTSEGQGFLRNKMTHRKSTFNDEQKKFVNDLIGGKSTFVGKLARQQGREKTVRQQHVEAGILSEGLIPNFATKILDRDQLSQALKGQNINSVFSSIVNAAAKRSQISETIVGTPGSGKTTLAMQKAGGKNFITNPKQLGPKDQLIVVRAAKTVIDSPEFTHAGKITYLKGAKEVIDKMRGQRTQEIQEGTSETAFGRDPKMKFGSTSGVLTEALLGEKYPEKLKVLERQMDMSLKEMSQVAEMNEIKGGFATIGAFSPYTKGHEDMVKRGSKGGQAVAFVSKGVNREYDVGLTMREKAALIEKTGTMAVPTQAGIQEHFERGGEAYRMRREDTTVVLGADRVSGGAEDISDRFRSQGFNVAAVPGRLGGVSGTKIRKAIINGDLKTLEDNLPKEIFSTVKKNLPVLQERGRLIQQRKDKAQGSLSQLKVGYDEFAAQHGARKKKGETGGITEARKAFRTQAKYYEDRLKGYSGKAWSRMGLGLDLEAFAGLIPNFKYEGMHEKDFGTTMVGRKGAMGANMTEKQVQKMTAGMKMIRGPEGETLVVATDMHGRSGRMIASGLTARKIKKSGPVWRTMLNEVPHLFDGLAYDLVGGVAGAKFDPEGATGPAAGVKFEKEFAAAHKLPDAGAKKGSDFQVGETIAAKLRTQKNLQLKLSLHERSKRDKTKVVDIASSFSKYLVDILSHNVKTYGLSSVTTPDRFQQAMGVLDDNPAVKKDWEAFFGPMGTKSGGFIPNLLNKKKNWKGTAHVERQDPASGATLFSTPPKVKGRGKKKTGVRKPGVRRGVKKGFTGLIPSFVQEDTSDEALAMSTPIVGVYDWDDTLVNYPRDLKGMPPIGKGVLSKTGLDLQASGKEFDVLTARSAEHIPAIKSFAAKNRLRIRRVQAIGDTKWKPGQRAADKRKALERYPKGTRFVDDDPENIKQGFLAGANVQQVGDPYGPSWKKEGKWRKEARGYAEGFVPNFVAGTGKMGSGIAGGSVKQEIVDAEVNKAIWEKRLASDDVHALFPGYSSLKIGRGAMPQFDDPAKQQQLFKKLKSGEITGKKVPITKGVMSAKKVRGTQNEIVGPKIKKTIEDAYGKDAYSTDPKKTTAKWMSTRTIMVGSKGRILDGHHSAFAQKLRLLIDGGVGRSIFGGESDLGQTVTKIGAPIDSFINMLVAGGKWANLSDERKAASVDEKIMKKKLAKAGKAPPLRAAMGLVPSFAEGALKEAIGREMSAGYDKKQVKVGHDSRLKKSGGVGVYNSTEGSLTQAINQHLASGKTMGDLQTQGASRGVVPNFEGGLDAGLMMASLSMMAFTMKDLAGSFKAMADYTDQQVEDMKDLTAAIKEQEAALDAWEPGEVETELIAAAEEAEAEAAVVDREVQTLEEGARETQAQADAELDRQRGAVIEGRNDIDLVQEETRIMAETPSKVEALEKERKQGDQRIVTLGGARTLEGGAAAGSEMEGMTSKERDRKKAAVRARQQEIDKEIAALKEEAIAAEESAIAARARAEASKDAAEDAEMNAEALSAEARAQKEAARNAREKANASGDKAGAAREKADKAGEKAKGELEEATEGNREALAKLKGKKKTKGEKLMGFVEGGGMASVMAAAPMVSGMISSSMDEKNVKGKAMVEGIGSAASMGATGAQMGAAFGPVGVVVGATAGLAVGYLQLSDAMKKAAIREKMNEVADQAEELGKKLNAVTAGGQSYMEGLDKLSSMMKDTTGKVKPEDLAKVKSKMAQALGDIPLEFQSRFREAAGDATKIKEIFGEITEELGKAKQDLLAAKSGYEMQEKFGSGAGWFSSDTELFEKKDDGGLTTESKRIQASFKGMMGGGLDKKAIEKALGEGKDIDFSNLNKNNLADMQKYMGEGFGAFMASVADKNDASDLRHMGNLMQDFINRIKSGRIEVELASKALEAKQKADELYTNQIKALSGEMDKFQQAIGVVTSSTKRRLEVLVAMSNKVKDFILDFNVVALKGARQLSQPFETKTQKLGLDLEQKRIEIRSSSIKEFQKAISAESKKNLSTLIGSFIKNSEQLASKSAQISSKDSTEILGELARSRQAQKAMLPVIQDAFRVFSQNPNDAKALQAVAERMAGILKTGNVKGHKAEAAANLILQKIKSNGKETVEKLAQQIQKMTQQIALAEEQAHWAKRAADMQARIASFGGAGDAFGGSGLAGLSKSFDNLAGSLDLQIKGAVSDSIVDMGRAQAKLLDQLLNTMNFDSLRDNIEGLAPMLSQAIAGRTRDIERQTGFAGRLARAENPDLVLPSIDAEQIATEQIASRLKLNQLPDEVSAIRQNTAITNMLLKSQTVKLISNNKKAFDDALKMNNIPENMKGAVMAGVATSKGVDNLGGLNSTGFVSLVGQSIELQEITKALPAKYRDATVGPLGQFFGQLGGAMKDAFGNIRTNIEVEFDSGDFLSEIEKMIMASQTLGDIRGGKSVADDYRSARLALEAAKSKIDPEEARAAALRDKKIGGYQVGKMQAKDFVVSEKGSVLRFWEDMLLTMAHNYAKEGDAQRGIEGGDVKITQYDIARALLTLQDTAFENSMAAGTRVLDRDAADVVHGRNKGRNPITGEDITMPSYMMDEDGDLKRPFKMMSSGTTTTKANQAFASIMRKTFDAGVGDSTALAEKIDVEAYRSGSGSIDAGPLSNIQKWSSAFVGGLRTTSQRFKPLRDEVDRLQKAFEQARGAVEDYQEKTQSIMFDEETQGWRIRTPEEQKAWKADAGIAAQVSQGGTPHAKWFQQSAKYGGQKDMSPLSYASSARRGPEENFLKFYEHWEKIQAKVTSRDITGEDITGTEFAQSKLREAVGDRMLGVIMAGLEKFSRQKKEWKAEGSDPEALKNDPRFAYLRQTQSRPGGGASITNIIAAEFPAAVERGLERWKLQELTKTETQTGREVAKQRAWLEFRAGELNIPEAEVKKLIEDLEKIKGSAGTDRVTESTVRTGITSGLDLDLLAVSKVFVNANLKSLEALKEARALAKKYGYEFTPSSTTVSKTERPRGETLVRNRGTRERGFRLSPTGILSTEPAKLIKIKTQDVVVAPPSTAKPSRPPSTTSTPKTSATWNPYEYDPSRDPRNTRAENPAAKKERTERIRAERREQQRRLRNLSRQALEGTGLYGGLKFQKQAADATQGPRAPQPINMDDTRLPQGVGENTMEAIWVAAQKYKSLTFDEMKEAAKKIGERLQRIAEEEAPVTEALEGLEAESMGLGLSREEEDAERTKLENKKKGLAMARNVAAIELQVLQTLSSGASSEQKRVDLLEKLKIKNIDINSLLSRAGDHTKKIAKLIGIYGDLMRDQAADKLVQALAEAKKLPVMTGKSTAAVSKGLAQFQEAIFGSVGVTDLKARISQSRGGVLESIKDRKTTSLGSEGVKQFFSNMLLDMRDRSERGESNVLVGKLGGADWAQGRGGGKDGGDVKGLFEGLEGTELSSWAQDNLDTLMSKLDEAGATKSQLETVRGYLSVLSEEEAIRISLNQSLSENNMSYKNMLRLHNRGLATFEELTSTFTALEKAALAAGDFVDPATLKSQMRATAESVSQTFAHTLHKAMNDAASGAEVKTATDKLIQQYVTNPTGLLQDPNLKQNRRQENKQIRRKRGANMKGLTNEEWEDFKSRKKNKGLIKDGRLTDDGHANFKKFREKAISARKQRRERENEAPKTEEAARFEILKGLTEAAKKYHAELGRGYELYADNIVGIEYVNSRFKILQNMAQQGMLKKFNEETGKFEDTSMTEFMKEQVKNFNANTQNMMKGFEYFKAGMKNGTVATDEIAASTAALIQRYTQHKKALEASGQAEGVLNRIKDQQKMSAEGYNKEFQATIALFDAGAASTNQLSQALQKANEAAIQASEYGFEEFANSLRMGFTYTTQDFKRDIDGMARSFGTDFRSGVSGAFSEAIKGTKTLKEAFADMFASMADKMLDKSLEMGVNAIFSAIGFNKGGEVKGYQTGGMVKGGDGSVDSVPAYLGEGEYVIRKAIVKQYGRPFFDSLNNNKIVMAAAGGGINKIASAVSAQQEKESALKKAGISSFSRKTKSETKKEDWLGRETGDFEMEYGTGYRANLNVPMTPERMEAMKAAANKYSDVSANLDRDLFDESSVEVGQGKYKIHLKNKFVYDNILTPSAGQFSVDSRLSAKALQDENNPQNQYRDTKMEAFFDYNKERLEYLAEQQEQYDAWKNEKRGRRIGFLFGAGSMALAQTVGAWKAKSGGLSPRDNIPALLTDGEYVINKGVVDKIGVGTLDRINSGVPMFQKGGLVEMPNSYAASRTSGNAPINRETRPGTTDGGTQTNNISITVNVDSAGNVESETSDQNNESGLTAEESKELAAHIKSSVLNVIVHEKRPGGMLYE